MSLGGGSKKSTSTRTVTMPLWLDARNKDLVTRAEALSNQPYEAFTGQRVAEFTPDELAAFQGTRDMTGKYQGMFDSGVQGVNQLFQRAQGPTAEDIQTNMNPFLENVLNITKRNEAENTQKMQQQLARQAGLGGSFGGSRFGLQQAQLEQDAARRMSDIDYSGRFDAYNQALGQFNRNTDVLSQAIGQGLNVGAAGQNYNINDLNALIATGSTQRALDQAKLDTEYSDFLEQRAYPYEQVNFLSNVLQPYSQMYAGDEQVTRQKGGGSGLGKVLGGLGTIASFIPGGQAIGMGLSAAGGLANGDIGSAVGSLFGGIGGSIFGTAGSQTLGTLFNPSNALGAGRYSSPIGPTMNPNFRGFYGMKDGGAVGYADGGPLAFERMTPAQKEAYKRYQAMMAGDAMDLPADLIPVEEIPTLPTVPPPMPVTSEPLAPQFRFPYEADDYVLTRGAKAIANGPIGDATASVLNAGGNALRGLVGAAGDTAMSVFSPSDAMVQASDTSAFLSQNPEEAKAAAMEAAKRFRAPAPQEPAPVASTVEQMVAPQETVMPPAPMQAFTYSEPNIDPRIAELSDLYIAEQRKRFETKDNDPNSKDFNIFGYKATVNMPLLKAGLAMMGSEGDFFEQLAAGGNAFAEQLTKDEEGAQREEEERMKALDNARTSAIDLATKQEYLKTAALQREQAIYNMNKANSPAEKAKAALEYAQASANLDKTIAMTEATRKGQIPFNPLFTQQ